MDRTFQVQVDSQMALSAGHSIAAIDRLRATRLRSSERISVVKTVARFAGAALAAGLLDALFPLPGVVRGVATLLFFTVLVRTVRAERTRPDSSSIAGTRR